MSSKKTEEAAKTRFTAAGRLGVFFFFLWATWLSVALGASFGQRHPGTTTAPTIYPTLATMSKPTYAPTTSPTKNPTTKTPTSNPTTAKPTTASPTP
jgi:hypothetical protein